MKTTTKAQLMFVPAICQDGGDERLNKGETFTDTQRTSPGGVVEAHHRERNECGPDATPASFHSGATQATVSTGHRRTTSQAMPFDRGDLSAGGWTGSDFPPSALIDGSGTDQGPLGTSVESGGGGGRHIQPTSSALVFGVYADRRTVLPGDTRPHNLESLIGLSTESKPMMKYRRRMAKLLGDALDRGDNVLVRRGVARLLKVVERAKH